MRATSDRDKIEATRRAVCNEITVWIMIMMLMMYWAVTSTWEPQLKLNRSGNSLNLTDNKIGFDLLRTFQTATRELPGFVLYYLFCRSSIREKKFKFCTQTCKFICLGI